MALRRAAIALAKESNGLDDGLYHSPLQGCGVPDLGNAETAQAQLNRRIRHSRKSVTRGKMIHFPVLFLNTNVQQSSYLQ